MGLHIEFGDFSCGAPLIDHVFLPEISKNVLFVPWPAFLRLYPKARFKYYVGIGEGLEAGYKI